MSSALALFDNRVVHRCSNRPQTSVGFHFHLRLVRNYRTQQPRRTPPTLHTLHLTNKTPTLATLHTTLQQTQTKLFVASARCAAIDDACSAHKSDAQRRSISSLDSHTAGSLQTTLATTPACRCNVIQSLATTQKHTFAIGCRLTWLCSGSRLLYGRGCFDRLCCCGRRLCGSGWRLCGCGR